MEVKVVSCFNTSLGLVVMIESSKDFLLTVGARLRNNDNEIWVVKGVSFKVVEAIKELNDNLITRGYQIEPLNTINNGSVDCETILLKKWFVCS